jgi:hypothetical protein
MNWLTLFMVVLLALTILCGIGFLIKTMIKNLGLAIECFIVIVLFSIAEINLIIIIINMIKG